MNPFNLNHLGALVKTETVETPEETIKVTGPLSTAFTKALNTVLKKKEGEVLPVLESFTDPDVIQDYILTRLKNRKDKKQTPSLIFAYNRNEIDRSVLGSAMIASEYAESEGYDYYVISARSDRVTLESDKAIEMPLKLERAMEQLCNRVGATYTKL